MKINLFLLSFSHSCRRAFFSISGFDLTTLTKSVYPALNSALLGLCTLNPILTLKCNSGSL